MCYRPIHIYNPSRRWNGDAPLRIAVPCGRCADCQRVKKNEWFFRAYQEYRYYRDKLNGHVYFVTLTYDNAHLPQMPLPDGSSTSAFNRNHIRNFIKYLRIYLKRRGIISKDIKFLVCSEYGENTKRPHYHALLFFPFYLDNLSFQHLMQSVWQHGFIVCSKLGWEITSPAGIRYASKYICKDIAFENRTMLRKYLYNHKFDEWKESVKIYLPKHWQSVGFGESFCDEIAKQKDIPAYLARNSVQLCLGESNSFPIPRYYHLKFEKMINKNYSKILDKVVIEPTEIGLKVKKIRFDEAILKDVSNLKTYNGQYFDINLPSSERFAKVFEHFKIYHPNHCNYFASLCCGLTNLESFSYDNFREVVCHDAPRLLTALDTFKFSMYRIFLRYMPLYHDEVPEHKFTEVSDIIANLICNDVFPPEYKDKIRPAHFDKFATPLKDYPVYKQTPICKDSPYFADYERLALMLDMFSFVQGLDKEYRMFTKDLEKDLCKKSCSPLPNIYVSF